MIQLPFEHDGSTSKGQLVYWATERTDIKAVSILQFSLEHGALVDTSLWEDMPELVEWARATSGASTTPLTNATLAGKIDSVRFLVDNGAGPAKNITCTVIECAKYRRLTEVEKLWQQNLDANNPVGRSETK